MSELVETAYGADEQASFDTATALMQRYPDLAGIVGTNSFALSATARAVQTANQTGKVMVTGLGTPNDMRQYVKDGVVPKFILWSPRGLGYLGMRALHEVIAGTLTGAEGETFDGGRLGQYTVGANGEVVLGKPNGLRRFQHRPVRLPATPEATTVQLGAAAAKHTPGILLCAGRVPLLPSPRFLSVGGARQDPTWTHLRLADLRARTGLRAGDPRRGRAGRLLAAPGPVCWAPVRHSVSCAASRCCREPSRSAQ